jgi:TldD protein
MDRAAQKRKCDMSEITRRDFLEAVTIAGAGALGSSLAGCRAPQGTNRIPEVNGREALTIFEQTEHTLQRVMARALSRGGDYCDLYFQNSRLNYLLLEDQAVNKAYSQEDAGVGIRVVKGAETGYAYTERLELPAILEAAAVAAAIAAGPARRVARSFQTGSTPHYYPVRTPWSMVTPAQKVDLLVRLHDLVRGKDRRLKKINISHTDEESLVLIADSRGRIKVDQQPMVAIYVSCTAEDHGRKESNFSSLGARFGWESLTAAALQKLATEAVQRTVVLFEAVPGPVGELPVVLAPGSSGILLHEAIGHGMEADFARQKTAIYADRVGQRIAPSFVNIVDDGTNPGLRGSINMDDEGNDSHRTVLVEGGILRTFIHDQISARHFGLPPTGNGRRESFRHMPIPRMRNTYMLSGPHAPEEIIRSVKRGLYAVNFTNGQVDIGAGDFTFYVKNGFLIEEGKLTRPIKDVNIIGNGPRVLEQVTMAGQDSKLDDGVWTCGKRGQGVPVGLGLPTLKVASITVGGTERKS